MIYVDRNKVPMPAIFYSKQVEIAKRRLEEFYARPKESRSQVKYSRPFDPMMRSEFSRAVYELFNGKCAYCESLIPLEVTKSKYNHFRPKSGARGFEKEFSTDHYWWLTYEWHNLYSCCLVCDQYKSTWFPVEGDRAAINTPILNEKALLIDPCWDRPEEHLVYKDQGEVDFLSLRGKTTIEIIKLNRAELVKARIREANKLKEQWTFFLTLLANKEQNTIVLKEIVKEWMDVFDGNSSSPYLGMQKQLLTNLLKEKGVNDYVNDIAREIFKDIGSYHDKTPSFPIEKIEGTGERIELTLEEVQKNDQRIKKAKHVYVEKVELKNFKCFSHLELSFNKVAVSAMPDQEQLLNEPWLLFLGENGVGKSSLLKAIVIGLAGDHYISDLGISGADILKHGTEEGFVKIYLVGATDPIEVVFNQHKIITSLTEPIVNIAAYNSIRLKPMVNKITPEENKFDGVKVKNLFDYTFSLVDADYWLAKLPKDIFDLASLTLKDLMLLDGEDIIEMEGTRAIVNKGKDKLYIDELSDGYKSIFYLAVDIMATFAGENVTFDLAEGIVLIDEIGTHLHPRWRMEVVSRLRKAFPRIKFIVTTHEPLCLRGLHAGETVVLTKNEDKEIVALTELPDPSELRVDQILTSDFFGLKSTIDPQTEQLFEEYYSILALDEADRTEEQKNRLLDLNVLVPRIKHLGDNLREELAYYVIDELLARKTRRDGLKIKDDLKAEAIKRIESLWNSLDNKTNLL
jgi:uncharacterized protein (TIGR02646 family)